MPYKLYCLYGIFLIIVLSLQINGWRFGRPRRGAPTWATELKFTDCTFCIEHYTFSHLFLSF